MDDRAVGLETWWYAAGELELGLLHALVADSAATNRHVDYASTMRRLRPTVDFRPDRPARMMLHDADEIELLHEAGEPVHRLLLETDTGVREVRGTALRVTAPDGRPAAVFALDDAGWEFRSEAGTWSAAEARGGSATAPPAVPPEPSVRLVPDPIGDGLWQTTHPVLGRVEIASSRRPVLRTGESIQEALAPESDAESRHDVDEVTPGVWRSRHLLGFRYIAIAADDPTPTVAVHSPPEAEVTGSFRCSDERLDLIWAAASRTLGLCMHGLIVDGIKRDRLPWMGDQALAIAPNAYAFGDARIASDGILALGQLDHGYVNGIADYSLWWFIAARSHLREFAVPGFAARVADLVEENLRRLERLTTSDGLLHPADEPGTFIAVFIDWGVEHDSARLPTALQVLWWWALRSAVEVLEAGGRDASRWTSLSDRVRDALVEHGWDGTTWSETMGDTAPEAGLHANLFAILSGLSEPSRRSVVDVIEQRPVTGTPFMAGFALTALGVAGRRATALAVIRDRWGAMLDAGPGTFWEEFASEGAAASDASMYGRPFGRSLCHAWSASPAALLPQLVLGVRPFADGWAEFEVDPQLGELQWAEARIPAPMGVIRVRASGDGVEVDVPAGAVCRFGGARTAGPARLVVPAD